jgi:urocanate hydratase
MQSMRSIVRDMNKNDDHVLRSDIASFINAGAGTVSAAQGIAKTLQGAEKVAVEKTASIFAKNVGSKTTAKTTFRETAIIGMEKLGVRAGAALTVPYLGEVLLAIDVITTLWQAIEESRKDNVYQIWIKLAGLSNAK